MLDVCILGTPCAVTTLDGRYLDMEAEMICGFYLSPFHKSQSGGNVGLKGKHGEECLSHSLISVQERDRERLETCLSSS